ncbi:MAG: DUF2065 domain-containing protein [Rhodospirillales bacterium]|nr:DUF2065 domain-containing protein [Rhodospirillales bacterium]MCB9996337.1 DUF2065 domain-containing protein [Rhodospirillales bacterium]
MSDFALYITTAFALIFVIEGLLYALFPDGIRRMFALALSLPPEKLRATGLVMAALGFCMVWLLQSFSGG